MTNTDGPVLIVDDNKLEALLITKCIHKNYPDQSVEHLEDGLEALNYLKTAESPSIILLDINMPRMNGLEFLKERKLSPKWLTIPTVVLSSSHKQSDKELAMKLGACGYMIKPSGLEEMTHMIKAIIDYWSHSEYVS